MTRDEEAQILRDIQRVLEDISGGLNLAWERELNRRLKAACRHIRVALQWHTMFYPPGDGKPQPHDCDKHTDTAG